MALIDAANFNEAWHFLDSTHPEPDPFVAVAVFHTRKRSERVREAINDALVELFADQSNTLLRSTSYTPCRLPLKYAPRARTLVVVFVSGEDVTDPFLWADSIQALVAAAANHEELDGAVTATALRALRRVVDVPFTPAAAATAATPISPAPAATAAHPPAATASPAPGPESATTPAKPEEQPDPSFAAAIAKITTACADLVDVVTGDTAPAAALRHALADHDPDALADHDPAAPAAAPRKRPRSPAAP